MKCLCAEMPDCYLLPQWIRGTVNKVISASKQGVALAPALSGLIKRKPYKFLSTLNFLDFNHEYWVALCQCSVCGQHWQFDWSSGVFRSLYAVKLVSAEGWPDTGMEVRLKALVDSRGGLGEETCDWSNCDHKVLRGEKLCPAHVYKMDERE